MIPFLVPGPIMRKGGDTVTRMFNKRGGTDSGRSAIILGKTRYERKAPEICKTKSSTL